MRGARPPGLTLGTEKTEKVIFPMASANAAAAHIFLSLTRFKQLVHQQVITRQKAGGYDLDTVRLQYLDFISAIARDMAAPSPLDLTRERAKLAREQGIMVALKNEVARDEFARVASVTAFLTTEHAIVRERLLSIPGKAADRLSGKSRIDCATIIRDEVRKVLAELAEADNAGDAGVT